MVKRLIVLLKIGKMCENIKDTTGVKRIVVPVSQQNE